MKLPERLIYEPQHENKDIEDQVSITSLLKKLQ